LPRYQHTKKFKRCVRKVSKKRGIRSAYAVCTASYKKSRRKRKRKGR